MFYPALTGSKTNLSENTQMISGRPVKARLVQLTISGEEENLHGLKFHFIYIEKELTICSYYYQQR